MAKPLKDRIPPHSNDAERAVLGAMLLDSEAIGAAGEKLSEKDFYSPNHGEIFKAILSLYNTGTGADLLTLCAELKKAGALERVGGEGYIAGLTSVVPTMANIEYYCKVVADCSLRREIIRAASAAIADAYNDSLEARETLEKTEQRIFELDESRHTVRYRPASDIIEEVIDQIEENAKRRGEYTGTPSGFPDLDSVTAGFQKQDLIIIGARPSQGKTALALTMAKHIAVDKKVPTAFFTLEMSDKQIVMRLLSLSAKVDNNSLRTGLVPTDVLGSLLNTASLIHDAPLFIVDVPNMKLLDLRSQARRLRLQEKIEILFIDYLGLIALESSGYSEVPRHQTIAEISRSLKSLARELNIPIVVLAQLNRQAAQEGAKPNLSVIRDSGAVEQDADLVMFIHRENDAEDSGEGVDTRLIIAKHRNGETRDIDLLFQKKYTLFKSKQYG